MVEKSIELLSQSTLKGERRKGKEKTLQKLLQDIAEMSDEPPPLEKSHDLSRKFVRKLVPDLKQPHPTFPAFSQAVAVQYDPRGVRGRYCVASRDIEAGELLAVETPFVWLLDKEAAREHCWHCFRSLLAPVPCPYCAGTLWEKGFENLYLYVPLSECRGILFKTRKCVWYLDCNHTRLRMAGRRRSV